uniref:Vitellinogen open beta-sheet domain-containing protein n=1 Tax=Romanomermis culicivorax TaxID=13658 RepID=A0A915JLP8_ROMCU
MHAESTTYEKNLHESFRALIYAQIKEQNVGFLPIDKNLLSKTLNMLKGQMNTLTDSLKRGRHVQITGVNLHRDMLIKIPTSAGLPLALTFRFPNIFSLNGKAKLIQNEGSDIGRSHGSSKNQKVEVDMMLSLESSMIINTEIWSPIINHGFKFENDLRLNVPLSFSAGIDPISRHGQNFHLIISPSQSTASTPKELIKMSIRPTNYAIKWNDYAKDFNSVSMDSTHSKATNTKQTCFEEFFSGRNMCIKNTPHKNPFALKTLEPTEFSIYMENKGKMQPVEITISSIHSSADVGSRTASGTSIDKLHVISKCGQRKASLNLARVFDPVEKVSRLHAILSSQADNRIGQMMCFDSEFMPLDGQRKLFVGGSSLKWGRSCESAKNYITVQINGEPYGASPDFLTHGAPMWKPSHQCTTPEKCDSSKNVYKMNVNYNLPVEIRNATNKIYRMFKHMFYEKSDVAQIDVKNPQNRVYVKLEVNAEEYPSGSLIIKINGEPYGASPDFLIHGAPMSKPSHQCTAPEKCDSNKNVYKMNVNYNLPVEIRNATNKIYRMFKHMFYEKSDVAQIDVKNPQNRVYVKLEVNAEEYPSGSLIIKSPGENLTLSHINLPSWFSIDSEEHSREKPHEKYMESTKSSSKRKSSTFSASMEAEHQPDHVHMNFEPEYDESESEFDLPVEFEHDSEDEKDFFHGEEQGEQDFEEEMYPPSFGKQKNDGVLKYKKNGLKEGSNWLREDYEKNEFEEGLYKKHAKREHRKPLWGDWLKESNDQKRGRDELAGYSRKNNEDEGYIPVYLAIMESFVIPPILGFLHLATFAMLIKMTESKLSNPKATNFQLVNASPHCPKIAAPIDGS